MTVALYIWLLLLVLLAVSVGVFAFEVFAAACVGQPMPSTSVPSRRRKDPVVVLVPAHNEALGIGVMLKALKRHLRSGDRVLVVADNCSDNTAELARAAGADVVERFNTALRGKGYALDHGVRALASDPPSCVIILDADCTVHPGALDALAEQVANTGRPAQAVYLMEHQVDNKAVSPVAVFAWRVRNLVRPLGLEALGGPCHLTGSGMAFPWPLLRDLDLATGHIVEDMKMGVDLAKAGHPPALCAQALVTSTFPVSKAGAQSQRTRWEHGTLGMLVSEVPRMLWQGVRGQGRGVLALALDMTVPPLALLAMLVTGAWALSLVFYCITGQNLPFQGFSALTAVLYAALACTWFKFGRDLVALSQLPGMVLYAVGKLPIYLKFFVKRQMEWVRAKRDAD